MELNAAEKICQRSKPDNLAARNEAQAAAISRFYQNQRCPEEQPSCEKTAVLLRNLDAITALFTQLRGGASGMVNAWRSYMQWTTSGNSSSSTKKWAGGQNRKNQKETDDQGLPNSKYTHNSRLLSLGSYL
jgi:hypothetical protein